MRAALSLAFMALALMAIPLAACRSAESARPVGSCTEACNAKASAHCSEDACQRGCTFVLDRLVEHEGTSVVACVANGSKSVPCDDALWAYCAVKIGIHADGGPPPPPMPED